MDFDIAVQRVVFADDEFEEVVNHLESTPLDKLELWDAHLPAETDEADVVAAMETLEAAGIDVVGYGVIDLGSPVDVAPAAATADTLGADYLTMNFDPEAEDIASKLVEAAERHELDVAVHNYSTVHHEPESVFSSIAEVRSFLNEHPHPRLGACVDSGHFLVMDEDPESAIRELGDRILSVHLKDTSETAEEDAPGRGVLDLPSLVALLEDAASLPNPLVIEYELPPEATRDALLDAYDRLDSL